MRPKHAGKDWIVSDIVIEIAIWYRFLSQLNGYRSVVVAIVHVTPDVILKERSSSCYVYFMPCVFSSFCFGEDQIQPYLLWLIQVCSGESECGQHHNNDAAWWRIWCRQSYHSSNHRAHQGCLIWRDGSWRFAQNSLRNDDKEHL